MDKFSYTYSAEQQEEIKKIRKKYMEPEEDMMEQLRKLDAGVTTKATVKSIVIGTIGTLILGAGMSCCLVGASNVFVPGIIIGIIGIAILSFAYPIYLKTVKKEKERVAPEILRLTEELLK